MKPASVRISMLENPCEPGVPAFAGRLTRQGMGDRSPASVDAPAIATTQAAEAAGKRI